MNEYSLAKLQTDPKSQPAGYDGFSKESASFSEKVILILSSLINIIHLYSVLYGSKDFLI